MLATQGDVLTLHSDSTGSTARYHLDGGTRYGGIEGPGDLVPNTTVRVSAEPLAGRLHAVSVSRGECGAPPEFALSCAPLAPSVEAPPAPAGYVSPQTSCAVTSKGSFSAPVELACFDLPPTLGCTFQPNPLTPPPNGSGTIALTVDRLPGFDGATRKIDIRATSAGVMRRSVQLWLSLPARPGPVTTAGPVAAPSALNPGAGASGPATRTQGPGPVERVQGPGQGAPAVPRTATGGNEGPVLLSLSIACAPDAFKVLVGKRASGVCVIDFSGHAVQPTRLSCDSPPPGLVCTFRPAELIPADPSSGPATTSVTIESGPGVAPGAYPIRIRAASGGLAGGYTISANVVPAPAPVTPDFAVACSPAVVSLTPSGSGASQCVVSSTGAFQDVVALSCIGQNKNVSCSVADGSVKPPPNGSAASGLDVSASAAAKPGTYSLLIRANRGDTTRTFTVTVTVASGQAG